MNCSADQLTFDSNNGDTSFKTFDMQKYTPGSYEFNLRASVGSEVSVTTEFTFNFTLVDPCPASTLKNLQDFPFIDLRYTLGRNSLEQKFDIAKLVELDTQVDCGKIKIEFID